MYLPINLDVENYRMHIYGGILREYRIWSAHKIEMEGKGTMPCRRDSLYAKTTHIEAMTK